MFKGLEQNDKLSSLIIDQNKLGTIGSLSLRKMIQLQAKNSGSLSILHLNNTFLGDAGIAQLSKGLIENSTILDLSIANNEIT